MLDCNNVTQILFYLNLLSMGNINKNQKAIKVITVLILLLVNKSYCQLGTSISFSTGKALGINAFYTKNEDSFYLGYSYQFNGQKNTVITERKQNYGKTPTGDGDYYWLVDFGYSRRFFSKLSVQPELSFGSHNYFTNYSDNRFRDNGYSLINDSKSIIGFGTNIGYLINSFLEPYLGFHTIKKACFGLRVHINLLN